MNISRRRFLMGSIAFAALPCLAATSLQAQESSDYPAFWQLLKHSKQAFNPKLRPGMLVRAVDDNNQLDIMFYDGKENGQPKFLSSKNLAIETFINMQYYHLGKNEYDKLALLAARRFDVLQKEKLLTKVVSHLPWRSRADAAHAVLSGQVAKVNVDNLCHDSEWLNKEKAVLSIQAPGMLETFQKKPESGLLPPYDPRYDSYEQSLIILAISAGNPLTPVVEDYLKNFEQIRKANPWPPKPIVPDEPTMPPVKMNRALVRLSKTSLQACIPG